jgi:hypothetical protein
LLVLFLSLGDANLLGLHLDDQLIGLGLGRALAERLLHKVTFKCSVDVLVYHFDGHFIVED